MNYLKVIIDVLGRGLDGAEAHLCMRCESHVLETVSSDHSCNFVTFDDFDYFVHFIFSSLCKWFVLLFLSDIIIPRIA